jgi:GWxTD domain-containing protein
MIPKLGWTLLHFFWQGTVIAIAYAALRGLFGRSYALACGALVAMVLAPPVTFLTLQAQAETQGLWTVSPSVVVAVWLAGVIAFSVRLLGGWRLTLRLRSTAHPAPAEWQQTLAEIAGRLGVVRPVRLMVSALVEVPTVIGWLRPAILVPVEALAGMPAGHLSALLAHEMAHIRRHDYLVSVLQSVVEAVLFYHPAVWWISEQMRREREFCCDDLAVAASGDVLIYAQALAALESRQQLRVAANGGSLVERIRRLLEPGRDARNSAPGAAAAWAMAVLWIAGIGVTVAHGAQQQAPPPPAMPLPVATTTRVRQALLFDPLMAQAAPEKAEKKSPWQNWLDEDVVYIATDEERREFLQLLTDEERERFVEDFWLKRDPTPGTQENEYKTEHYRRIEYANKHFSARMPGWKTDRGKTYIVLGPPDEIDAHPYGIPGSPVPFEQWRYAYVAGIGSKVQIEFRGADYALQNPLEFDAQRNAPRLNLGQNPRSVILPMQVQVDYVRATQSSTMANITVQFDTKDLQFTDDKAHVNVFLRLTTMTRRPVTTSERSLETPADGSRTVYQQSVPLAPGRYRLNVVAKDIASGKLNTYEAALEVPAFGEDRLAAGSLVLADRIEKIPALAPPDAFVIGDVKVRPRVGNRFAASEKLGIYLQVYNFAPDAATGKPGGSVAYQVDKAGSGEKLLTFSEEIAGIADSSASQVTIEKMLPLQTVGPGSYVLRVSVVDRNGASSVQREAPFTVTPE